MVESPLRKRQLRCFAVRTGIDPLLEVARTTHTEAIDDAYELLSQWSKSLGIGIKLTYTPGKGFFFTCPRSQLPKKLPPQILHVHTTKQSARFTTLDMLKLNDRVAESIAEIFLISDK